jgi:hypothetical protein
MQYYRCKCGKATAWVSYGPYACNKCNDCGSNLAWSPDSHQEPKPHEFKAHDIDTDEGPKPLSRCIYCHRTRKQIEESKEIE